MKMTDDRIPFENQPERAVVRDYQGTETCTLKAFGDEWELQCPRDEAEELAAHINSALEGTPGAKRRQNGTQNDKQSHLGFVIHQMKTALEGTELDDCGNTSDDGLLHAINCDFISREYAANVTMLVQAIERLKWLNTQSTEALYVRLASDPNSPNETFVEIENLKGESVRVESQHDGKHERLIGPLFRRSV